MGLGAGALTRVWASTGLLLKSCYRGAISSGLHSEEFSGREKPVAASISMKNLTKKIMVGLWG